MKKRMFGIFPKINIAERAGILSSNTKKVRNT